MSKITFRADDELIDELESFEDSKSEVMRRALREYLADHPEADVHEKPGVNPGSDVNGGSNGDVSEGSLDELVAERVDAIIERRLDATGVGRKQPQDVNVNITLDGDASPAASVEEEGRKTATPETESESDGERKTCGQCGENVDSDHVYCPNCGEKTSHRAFCECGDELRSDWAFCPSCGRRTPAADVLDNSIDGS